MNPGNLLRAKAALLRSLAADLEAEAEQLDEPTKNSVWLDLGALATEFGFSRESLASAARDGLSVSRGAKGRLMARRVDVESWLSSRRWTPPESKQRDTAPKDDPDAGYGAQLARLEVVR